VSPRAATLVLLCAATCAQAAGVDDALRAGELICEFRAGYKRSMIADALGEVQVVEQMLVYEAVAKDSAKVVSTRAPGRRPVTVRATAKAVHFIERAGPSVLVTTLTRCERTRLRHGEETCVRFAAQHAWHFDLAVLKDPDESLARQPNGAMKGVCEPWALE
jgi:hypothetical protein